MENLGRNDVAELREYMAKQLRENNVAVDFPSDVAAMTREDIASTACRERKNFRHLKAFTIDSAECKDMDDAVSVEKTGNGYTLGVHIADVSAYVTPNSRLDEIAVARATSIYLPGLTIPMLPGVLSQDLCSLNPMEDRNTLSVMIRMDENCDVTSYYITKAVIRSKVKGVYSEVNQILDGTASDSVKSKYSSVISSIHMMRKIARELLSKRVENGAMIQNNSEPKVTLFESEIDVTPETRGAAESMIEEFMVLANNLVAEYMAKNRLPVLYRAQVSINKMAEYVMVKSGHASLRLECYSHFTSPIRRLADLKTHQILSLHLNGVKTRTIEKLFDDETMTAVCEQATKKARRAHNLCYTCLRFCYARYFNWHGSERYNGIVSGFDRFHNPLITLDDYNIKVVGNAALHTYLGKKVSLQVIADAKNVLRAGPLQLAA